MKKYYGKLDIDEDPRLLSIVDSAESQQQQEINSKQGLIFDSGLQSKIKLELFTSNFMQDGISLWDEG